MGRGGKKKPKESSENGAIRHLNPEEGWRFLYIRKGDELMTSQLSEVEHLRDQVGALRQAAQLILDKASGIEKFAQEVAKRIQAQTALWNSGHAPFKKQLNLPDNSSVSYNQEKDNFEVRVATPPQPPAGQIHPRP